VLQGRIPARWYALAVVGLPAVTVAVTVALTGAPGPLTASSVTTAVIGGLLLQLVAVLLTVNLWEEVAWAGFVQARLRRRRGPVVSAVVTGALFGLGHVSVVAEGPPVQVAALLPLLVIVSIPFRFSQSSAPGRSPTGPRHPACCPRWAASPTASTTR
jgi:membrane protease YdiL (CAAX protease family)